jgi:hypothetical protein
MRRVEYSCDGRIQLDEPGQAVGHVRKIIPESSFWEIQMHCIWMLYSHSGRAILLKITAKYRKLDHIDELFVK